MSRLQVPALLRLLYNHNPFYLMSTGLCVYGLKVFFKPFEAEYIEPWSLMGSLCLVTLLMAVTAYLIVRFGRVWEDARTIVLALLMMFFAISVSFDEIVTLISRDTETAGQALALMSCGLSLSILISEGLMRGLSIKIPWSYRIPFYGLLALFFGFPLWVSPDVSGCSPEIARWRVAAFPLIAALITLGLLPAVRRGRESLRDNGTPWSWPCLPWCVFVFMGIAVCFRSYSLGISFDRSDARSHYWDTSFGLYFLIPFLWAVLVVLLEISLVERLAKLQKGLMLVAPSLLLLFPQSAGKGWHHSRELFLRELIEHAASPLFMTLCLLLAFYAYAWSRRVRTGELGFVAISGLLLMSSPTSMHLDGEITQWWPLAMVGLVEGSIGLRCRQSMRALVGFGCGIVGGASLLQGTRGEYLMVPLAHHASMFGLLLVTTYFNDNWARKLRPLSAIAVGVTCILAIVTEHHLGVRTHFLPAYVIALTSVCFALSADLRELAYALAGGSIVCVCGMGVTWKIFLSLRAIDGALPLVAAAGCFVVGITISVLKAGLGDKLERRFCVPEAASATEPPSNEN